jgi:hypothetical protein
MSDYLNTAAIKAGKDLWNKDDGKIMIVHQEMDDKTSRYLFFIF